MCKGLILILKKMARIIVAKNFNTLKLQNLLSLSKKWVNYVMKMVKPIEASSLISSTTELNSFLVRFHHVFTFCKMGS